MDRGAAPWGLELPTALLETKSGDLFVGTLRQGLYLLSPDGTSLHFTRQNGLSHNWVLDLCEDRERNLWVGTGGGGLDVLRRRKVEMVKPPDDWQGRAILAVTPDAEGGLWVGTEGAGLYRLEHGEVNHYAETNGLANFFIWSVLEDSQRQLWVGTFDGGLFIRHDEKFEFPKGLEDPTAIIFALYQDRQGVHVDWNPIRAGPVFRGTVHLVQPQGWAGVARCTGHHPGCGWRDLVWHVRRRVGPAHGWQTHSISPAGWTGQ